MVEVARAALGDTIHLFNEQFVVKAADRGLPFSWHQDSGFIPYRHRPHLTCWIPLDDASDANGTVHMLPYARVGTRDVVRPRHLADPLRIAGRRVEATGLAEPVVHVGS
jgi:ectoine hydroxylase-related dioxygenase (phytanoyl-CoA dioxygenase family)